MRKIIIILLGFLSVCYIGFCDDEYVGGKKYLNTNLVDVKGMSAPATAMTGSGRLYFDSTANKLKLSESRGDFGNVVTFASNGNLSISSDATVEGILWTEQIESDGDLSLNGLANGDIHIFHEGTVGNTTDGKALYLWRNAESEASSYLKMYGNQYFGINIYADWDLVMDVPNGNRVSMCNTTGDGLQVGSTFAAKNAYYRFYGRIAGANPYVDFQLEDTDDTMIIDPSDSTIKGLSVGMNLTVANNIFITSIPTSDPGVVGALWSNGGDLQISS